MTLVIKPAKHRCWESFGTPQHGLILECSKYGKWWRGHEPGNPDYATWRRAWVRQVLSRARQKKVS